MKLRDPTLPPKTIVELRKHTFPPFPPVTEFTVRHWINAANTSLEDGERKWREWRMESVSTGTSGSNSNTTGGGGEVDVNVLGLIKSDKIEEAFLDIRKAALIAQHMKSHPGFEKIKKDKLSEYYSSVDLTGRLSLAARTNGEIAVAIEKREEAWKSLHSTLDVKSVDSSAALSPKVARASVDSNITGNTVRSGKNSEGSGSIINGDSTNSPNASTTSIVATSSPPLNTIEQRMAALRSKGLATPALKPTIRSNVPSIPSPASPVPSTSSSTSSSSLLPVSPPKPVPHKKPEALVGLGLKNTPPGSPRGPIIRNGAAVVTTNLNESVVTSNEGGSKGDRSPVSPTTTFGGQFPSLDELENRFSSNNPYSSPTLRPTISAPSITPTITMDEPPIRSSRPPLPPTPRAVNGYGVQLSEEEHRIREASRAEAMAKLSGNISPPLRPYAPPPVSNGSRNSYQPSQQQQQQYSPSFDPISLPPAGPSISPKLSSQFSSSYSNEILPAELYTILAGALNSPDGPRILLLDVREREEYERERIRGETVCLEPVILRNGVSSIDLESSLSVSPSHESLIFNSRHTYDRVVIYDQSSTSLPNSVPPSTSSAAQHQLYNLTSAIYEREFRKSLKKQPVLLVGGWEAWKTVVGIKGMIGMGVSIRSADGVGAEVNPAEIIEDRRRIGVDDLSRIEAKKANRETMVISPDYRNGHSNGAGTYLPSTNTLNGAYTSNYYPIGAGAVLVSAAEVALPPTAIQRSGGPLPSYDQFAYQTSRPSYTQPNINNFGGYANPSIPTSPSLNSLNSSQNQLRVDYGSDTLSQSQSQQQQQSFTNYSNGPRPSIDYPSLRPAVNQFSRPLPSINQNQAPIMPMQTLTRPAPVQPAPLRSNSSFSGVSVAPYASATPYSGSLQFGEDTIGLTGLKNLGNTCYMNSTIQCLSATISFARYFREGVYKSDINNVNPLGTKGILASAVAELIRAIWSQQYTSLSPITFRENICRWAPQFRGSDQHDAQEFLGFLLDGLHEDLNYVRQKPLPVEMTPDREHDLETLPPQIMSQREWDIYRMRNDSFVVRSFQGQFRNQMKCLTCSKTSTTYNTFMSLSIPIPVSRSKVTLEDCLATFVREEILDKEDAWFCPRCKCARKASKKLSLSRLPPILLIQLKRFSFKGPFSDKIETQVTYPLSGLDLTAFIPPPLFDPRALPLTSSPKGYVYDLYGVTNHYGTLSSGHYTAYVRNHRDWHHIGDSKVSRVDPEVVQSNRSAYILFFRLR